MARPNIIAGRYWAVESATSWQGAEFDVRFLQWLITDQLNYLSIIDWILLFAFDIPSAHDIQTEIAELSNDEILSVSGDFCMCFRRRSDQLSSDSRLVRRLK